MFPKINLIQKKFNLKNNQKYLVIDKIKLKKKVMKSIQQNRSLTIAEFMIKGNKKIQKKRNLKMKNFITMKTYKQKIDKKSQ